VPAKRVSVTIAGCQAILPLPACLAAVQSAFRCNKHHALGNAIPSVLRYSHRAVRPQYS
jgi:hypothetical protein